MAICFDGFSTTSIQNPANFFCIMSVKLNFLMLQFNSKIIGNLLLKFLFQTMKKLPDYLLELFPDHVVINNGHKRWPARLPDLSSSEYYLWELMDNIVYKCESTVINNMEGRN